MSKIICAYPKCSGFTEGDTCTIHGKICSHCGVPCEHTGADRHCNRCDARTHGAKCEGCGSPWIYITYYLDKKWRCKPCVRALIRENDWEETEEEAKAKVRQAAEQYTVAQQERKLKKDALADQVDKQTKRRYKNDKQDETLFVLQDPKKKRK